MTTQSLSPRGLDDLWRARVSFTQTVYLHAKDELDHAIRDSVEGADIEALHVAQTIHDRCLQHYLHALRTFEDLILNGVPPDQPSPD